MNRDKQAIGARRAFKLRRDFLEAVKGYQAHQITRVLNKWNRGVSWTGCSKESLAETYAAGVESGEWPDSVTSLYSLSQLTEQVKEMYDNVASS